jgi:hypothetical protein
VKQRSWTSCCSSSAILEFKAYLGWYPQLIDLERPSMRHDSRKDGVRPSWNVLGLTRLMLLSLTMIKPTAFVTCPVD